MNHWAADKLPGNLPLLLKNADMSNVQEGESGAKVVMISGLGNQYFLKIDKKDKIIDRLHDEYQVILWLSSRFMVPEVILFEADDHYEYLLTRAMPGTLVKYSELTADPGRLISCYAAILNSMHSINTKECPFDQSLDVKLELAESRIANNEISWNYVNYEGKKFSPPELWKVLNNDRPDSQFLTFSHGDPYLNNMFFHQNKIKGLIDWARGGCCDYHYDLAIAAHNISQTVGMAYVRDFLKLYRQIVDCRLLAYYWALNEFF